MAAATGVVLATSGQSVTVDLGAGGSETLEKLRGVVVAAGDLAHITTVGRARFVDGVIGVGSAPTPESAETVPPPAPQNIAAGSWGFTPIDAGSWRDGWRDDTSLLWQGRHETGGLQYGAAWYGEGPSALPGQLVAVDVEVQLAAGVGPVAPSMALYAETVRPDGQPTLLASASGPLLEVDGPPVTWRMPEDWAALLGSGAAGGLGCYVPGDVPALALSGEGAGMAITCYWEDLT